VTRPSVERLGLEEGGRVTVYVKATELTLGV
jgi:molybdopterin-binding protein